MKAKWVVVTGIFCLACAAGILMGQEKEDRTLLSHEQMTAIINEVSGERAMHHVLELVPYQFVRPPSEYQGHFRESEVMAKFAREYGFSNVAIEDYPTGQTYQPVVGELWTTTPKKLPAHQLQHAPTPGPKRRPDSEDTAPLRLDMSLRSRVDQGAIAVNLLNRPAHRGQRAHRIAGGAHQKRHSNRALQQRQWPPNGSEDAIAEGLDANRPRLSVVRLTGGKLLGKLRRDGVHFALMTTPGLSQHKAGGREAEND